jgi:hypothetical protein
LDSGISSPETEDYKENKSTSTLPDWQWLFSGILKYSSGSLSKSGFYGIVSMENRYGLGSNRSGQETASAFFIGWYISWFIVVVRQLTFSPSQGRNAN